MHIYAYMSVCLYVKFTFWMFILQHKIKILKDIAPSFLFVGYWIPKCQPKTHEPTNN